MADLYGTYDKRIKFTIDNTKIDATLTWIPITVLLTSTAGEEVFVELDADSDFDKCAFTKADETTELYADCELYDVSGEVAIYHVSLDGWEIASGTDTDFYMYYDDDASANTSKISKSGGTAAQSVYDANFKAVYHMHDFDNYDTKYEATVEPDDDGWTLGGTDYSSVAGGILTIDTSADDGYTCYYYKTPDVDFNTGVYLKTSVKASTDMDDAGDAFHIQIQDGTQNERFWMKIRDGKVEYLYESNNNADFVLDTTTGYVTYEIYIKGSTFWIYADGVQKVSQVVDAETVSDLVQFGDISPDAGQMCKAEIDYVYYALGVINNPVNAISDSTSNNNDGTKKGIGEPVEAAGKVGQGQDFDGGDDHVRVPDAASLDMTNNITLEAIVKSATTEQLMMIIDKNNGGTFPCNYMWRTNATGEMLFAFYNTEWITQEDTQVDITDNAYHHVVVTYDQSNVRFYVDGAAKDAPAETTALVADGNDVMIGILEDETNYGWHDIIDEATISSTAVRSAAWVKARKESLWDSLLTYGSEETSGVVVDNAIFFGCNF